VNTAMWVRVHGGTIARDGSRGRCRAGTGFTWKQLSSLITGRRVDETWWGSSRKGRGEISPISDARGTAAYKRLYGAADQAHFLTIFPNLSVEALLEENIRTSIPQDIRGVKSFPG